MCFIKKGITMQDYKFLSEKINNKNYSKLITGETIMI